MEKYLMFFDEPPESEKISEMYRIAEENRADVVSLERGSEIEILDSDLSARIDRFCAGDLSLTLDGKIFRRDFLIEHQISIDDEPIFIFNCLCHAKSYIIIGGENRDSKIDCSIEKNMQGLQKLARIMKSIPHFESNPKDRDRVLDFFFELQMRETSIDQFLRREEFDSKLDSIFIPRFGSQSKFVETLFKTANLIQVKDLRTLFREE